MPREIIVANMVSEEGENPVEVRWMDRNRWEVTKDSRFAISITNDHRACFMVLDFTAVQKLHEELALMLEIEEDIREGRDDRVGVGYFSRRRAR